MPPRLIALGAVVRAHGIRGELRVHRFNPESPLLLDQRTVWLKRGEAARNVAVEASRAHGDAVLFKLRGVDTREQAELLRGDEVCVDRAVLPALEPGEHYHTDIIGLRARADDGRDLGVVVSILRYPTADCALVRAEEGDREVPLLPPYVMSIDIESGILEVNGAGDLDLVPRKR
jgi:16S rRNA processing protein RimM